MNRPWEILVVDDNPENLRVLSGLLERKGYDVSACLSGERALGAVHHRNPDLVLLDVNMPGLNGFQVCERMRSDPELRRIPVIFLTARTRSEDVVNGLAIGAVDYVSKPFQPEELLARVSTHIELNRSRREIHELRDLLPVCAWCHRVREDDGYWQSMERYVASHGGPKTTHGICPDCIEKIKLGQPIK